MTPRAPGPVLVGAMLLTSLCLVPLRVAAAGQAISGDAPDLTLVMPFEPASVDPVMAWLPEASAILLADGLIDRGVLTLDLTTRSRVLKELELPVSASLSLASIIHIGEVIGATQVVTGTLAVEGRQLVVTVHRVPLGSLGAEPPVEVRAPLADLMQTFDAIADRLAPSGPGKPASDRVTIPADAFERYVKGVLAAAPTLRVELLREAVARAPDDMRARLALWDAITDAGDSEGALQIALSVPPESSAYRQARILAARSLVNLGRLDEAFDTLDRLRREAADAQVYEILGLVQLRGNDPSKGGRATYYYQQVVDLVPDDPDALFNLGYAYWIEGDAPAASYWLRRAVERRPTDGVARYVLGLTLGRQGRSDQSARELALARRVSDEVAGWTGDSPARVQSGELARVRPAVTAPGLESIEARLRGAARVVGERLARHHLERGRALVEAGHDEAAMTELDRAIQLAPQLPDAFVVAGRLHLRAGRTEAALHVLRLAPESPAVTELLTRIRTAGAR